MKIYLACTVRGDRGGVAAGRAMCERLHALGHEVLTTHLLADGVDEAEAALPEADVFRRDLGGWKVAMCSSRRRPAPAMASASRSAMSSAGRTHGPESHRPVQHRPPARHLARHHRQLRPELHDGCLLVGRGADRVHRAAIRCSTSGVKSERKTNDTIGALSTTAPQRAIPLADIRDAATAVYGAAIRTPLVRIELPEDLSCT
jgi:hypothetical protein